MNASPLEFNIEIAMSAPLISYGEVEVLQRKAEYSSSTSSRLRNVFSRSIDARVFFDIDESVRLLVEFRSSRSLTRRLRVALQFPDDLLGDARLVCGLLRDTALERQLEMDCFVLGEFNQRDSLF